MKKKYIAPSNKNVRLYTRNGLLQAGLGIGSGDLFEGGGNAKERSTDEYAVLSTNGLSATAFDAEDKGPWESLW